MASSNASYSLEISKELKQIINRAAELLLNCDALIFTSGAGMGVSSGLGTFRGVAAGVWPPLLEHPTLDFTDMSDPSWFEEPQGNSAEHDTANFAYAFWAYRYNAYTSVVPHHGYIIAKEWSQLPQIKAAFSFTSNIDGHWLKSGWKESTVLECHGSIHYMQCINNCSDQIWPTNQALNLKVDPQTNCVIDPLPTCSDCHELARPNVRMFNDFGFFSQRCHEQRNHYKEFEKNLKASKTNLLIIELGAGIAVPTVRLESERLFSNPKWTANFIRINPLAEHASIPHDRTKDAKGEGLEIALDALTALTLIDEAFKKKLNQ